MARVSVFGEVWNSVGTSQSVGGRRGNPYWVKSRLNTDNAGGSDCSITTRAEVRGESCYGGLAMRKTCRNCKFQWTNNHERECPVCGITRQGIDTRDTVFTIELPEPNEHCQVRIREHNAELADLAAFGGFLATIKGASQLTSPDPQVVKSGEEIIKNVGKILEDMKKDSSNLPKVTLPGNVDLAHALACVEIVERLMRSQDDSPYNGSAN